MLKKIKQKRQQRLIQKLYQYLQNQGIDLNQLILRPTLRTHDIVTYLHLDLNQKVIKRYPSEAQMTHPYFLQTIIYCRPLRKFQLYFKDWYTTRYLYEIHLPPKSKSHRTTHRPIQIEEYLVYPNLLGGNYYYWTHTFCLQSQ